MAGKSQLEELAERHVARLRQIFKQRNFFLRRVLVGIGEAARSGDSDAHECIECKCGSVVLEKKGMTMTSPLHLYHVDFYWQIV